MCCKICLSGLSGDLVATSCGHVFHKQCLRTWLQRHSDCPLCRSPKITHFRIFLNLNLPKTDVSVENRVEQHAIEIARVQMERAAIQVETNRLRQQLAACEERMKLASAKHELQIQGLMHDSRYFQHSFMELRERITEMKREEEDLLTVRRAKERELMERWDRRNANLKAQENNLLAAIQSVLGRVKSNAKGHNNLSIRNLPASVVQDPKKEVMELLTWLDIQIDPEELIIVSCTEMVPDNRKYQILMEFVQISKKIELMAKFSSLSEHNDSTVRQLNLRDSLVTHILFKQAKRTLHAKKGIVKHEIVNDQVVIKLKGETEVREITNEEDILAIVQILDNPAPSTTNCSRRRGRR